MIRQRASAKRDLIDHYVYLAEQAGEAVADRFLKQAEESFHDLARHPAMGAPLSLRSPRLRACASGGLKNLRTS